MHTHNLALREDEIGIADLADHLSSRFIERTSLKEIRQRSENEAADLLLWTLYAFAYACVCM